MVLIPVFCTMSRTSVHSSSSTVSIRSSPLNLLTTWCEDLTHLKRSWCWERLKVGGEGDNRGWDGWMASSAQWTWVSKLRELVMDTEAWRAAVHGLQRVRHDWMTELNWTDAKWPKVLGGWKASRLLGWLWSLYCRQHNLAALAAAVQLLSPVQLFCDPMDCSPPGSSVHGISQARILLWTAISRGSSWPRDQTCISCLAGGFSLPLRELGSLSLY